MRKFDFDVKSFLSIQPKTRKKLTVFNGIKSIATKSNIINEYKDTNFIPNSTSRRSQTYLAELLSTTDIQIGEMINNDVGMNTLKPELIGVFDFLRIVESDNQKSLVSKFIDYSYMLRQYKEEQIQNIIKTIQGVGENSEIKLAQRNFRNKLLETSSVLRTFFSQISENLNNANNARTYVMGMKHNRSAVPVAYDEVLTALSIDASDIQEFTNNQIMAFIVAEARRNFFTTSKIWDADNSFVIIDNNKHVKFKRFNDLLAQDLSPYHLYSQEAGRVIGYNIFANDDDSNTNNLIRELMSIMITEAGCATAIAKIARRGEVISTIAQTEIDDLVIGANSAFPAESDIKEIIIKNVQLTSETSLPETVDIHLLEFKSTMPQVADVGAQVLFSVDDVSDSGAPIQIENKTITYENAYLRIIRNLDVNLNNRLFDELNQSKISFVNSTIIRTMQQEMILNYDKITSSIPDIIDSTFDFRTSALTNGILQDFARLRNGPDPIVLDANGLNGPTMSQIIALARAVTSAIENTDPSISNSFISQQLSRLLKPAYVVYFIENIAEIFLISALNNFELAKAIFGLCLARNDITQSILHNMLLTQKLDGISERFDYKDANDNITARNYNIGEIIDVTVSLDTGFSFSGDSVSSLADVNFADFFTQKIISMFANNIDVSSRSFVSIVTSIYTQAVAPSEDEDIKIKLIFGESAESVTFQYTNVMKQVFQLLTKENGLISKINTKFREFFPDPYLPFDYTKKFTTRTTAFNKIDYNLMLMVYFELFRKTLVNNLPFNLYRGNNNEVTIKVDLQNENLGAMLMSDFKSRTDYQTIIEPLRKQHTDGYNKYVTFRQQINNAFRLPLFRDQQLSEPANLFSRLEERITELRDKFSVNIPDIFNRGAIDQIETIATLIKQFDDLNSAGISNLETFIAKNEKRFAISQLAQSHFVKNIAKAPSLEDPSGPLVLLPEQPSTKIVAIGIPMGFKSEINKLLLQNEDFFSLNDPRYSNVLIDIYERDITERNDFSIIKTARFDIDLFVDRTEFVTSQANDFTLSNIKLFDRNNMNTKIDIGENNASSATGPPSSLLAAERRFNEAQSHALKTYIKLLFGINFDESQFFVNRAILDIDPADSENESFNKMFDTLVNNKIDKQIKIKTQNTNRLEKNIQSLIAQDGSRLRQFSNNLFEISKRDLISESLSGEDKKIKLELEDAAVQIASVFQFSEDLSGGDGFFKRLVSPKLFEKIILIDIPCHINCVSDFYAKIRIEK